MYNSKQAKNFGNQALKLLKSVLQNYYSKEDCVSMKAIDYFVNSYTALNKTKVLQKEANIKIIQVNLNYLEVEKDSMNAGFRFEQEIINIAKIGVQCSIKDPLNYIILYLEQSNILKCTDPVIHLQISSDG
ncbi:24190_t:CDS:2 [Dentiscutata erythropus]|uniref:24190_t:CDS:1 n=1 Tax=Dentiscutata erythropus TaxID=1348616 RepID=A0A9N9NYV1_9GLOM|nr:24190_t:CDS:2 [Dentiscutata erythropus]